MVTASHNPKNYNGIKFVKSGSEPLDPFSEFERLKLLAENSSFENKNIFGNVVDFKDEAKKSYLKKMMHFVDKSPGRPIKLVVNCGNGAAGPTFNLIETELKKYWKDVVFEKMFFDPDGNFPNGVPNPLEEKNRLPTAKRVIETKADIGIAFDGDFDRCFFFDDKGNFISGEYIVGLLAEFYLKKEKSSAIVHDIRILYNIEHAVKSYGGRSVQSRTGHAFIKQILENTMQFMEGFQHIIIFVTLLL